jgi:hypothetical protein
MGFRNAVTLIKVPVYTKRPSRLCERRSEAGPRFVCESDHCAGRQIRVPGSLAEELYSVADPETFSSLTGPQLQSLPSLSDRSEQAGKGKNGGYCVSEGGGFPSMSPLVSFCTSVFSSDICSFDSFTIQSVRIKTSTFHHICSASPSLPWSGC